MLCQTSTVVFDDNVQLLAHCEQQRLWYSADPMRVALQLLIVRLLHPARW